VQVDADGNHGGKVVGFIANDESNGTSWNQTELNTNIIKKDNEREHVAVVVRFACSLCWLIVAVRCVERRLSVGL
jgi:hypothetical protein